MLLILSLRILNIVKNTYFTFCVSILHCLQFWGIGREGAKFSSALCCSYWLRFMWFLYSCALWFWLWNLSGFICGSPYAACFESTFLQTGFMFPFHQVLVEGGGGGGCYQPNTTLCYSRVLGFAGPYWYVNSNSRFLGGQPMVTDSWETFFPPLSILEKT